MTDRPPLLFPASLETLERPLAAIAQAVSEDLLLDPWDDLEPLVRHFGGSVLRLPAEEIHRTEALTAAALESLPSIGLRSRSDLFDPTPDILSVRPDGSFLITLCDGNQEIEEDLGCPSDTLALSERYRARVELAICLIYRIFHFRLLPDGIGLRVPYPIFGAASSSALALTAVFLMPANRIHQAMVSEWDRIVHPVRFVSTRFRVVPDLASYRLRELGYDDPA